MGSLNVRKSKGGSLTLLTNDHLNEKVLVILLELVPKTQNYQVYQPHDFASLGLKNRRV